MGTSSHSGRIVLVTGASRGIGRAVAKAFAGEGAHVIAIARPRSKSLLEELDDEIRAAGGEPPTLVPLDLKDGAAIDALGAAIFERWGKLDVLVGNAALLGSLGPLGHIDLKEWDQVMAVNVTSNWRLVRAMDPLLRASDAGRAVFVTSGVTRSFPAYWGTYSVSKAALEALAHTYAAEVEKTDIRVNMINPGPIRTAMRAKAMPGEDPETLPAPDQIAPLYLELGSPDCSRHDESVNFYEWAKIAR